MDQNYQTYPEDGEPIPPVDELPPAPKKKGMNAILIVVIVLLLLCCCCIAFTVITYQWLGDIITDALGITQWIAPNLFSA
jgi:hypothetical protein